MIYLFTDICTSCITFWKSNRDSGQWYHMHFVEITNIKVVVCGLNPGSNSRCTALETDSLYYTSHIRSFKLYYLATVNHLKPDDVINLWVFSLNIFLNKFFQLMKSSPEYNYLQDVLACAMKWYDMYIICIEINKHKMIIYEKNIGKDNVRKKRTENKYFWRCVLVL